MNKIVGIISNLQNVHPRSVLLTVYKSFDLFHLFYGDIIYKVHNESVKQS